MNAAIKTSKSYAVLTEPMAVAAHAVNRSEVGRRDVAVVLGCGPIGLAVICTLKARGVRTIVASDPSAGRRELARRCGADVVVDPREDSPYDAEPRVQDQRLAHAAARTARMPSSSAGSRFLTAATARSPASARRDDACRDAS